VSKAPLSARSFERIEIEDLARLAEIGLARIDLALRRHAEKRSICENRLLGLCLCQGAADHYAEPLPGLGRGVHDFDLWAFFRAQPCRPLWNRAGFRADFGASKFGRSPLDPQKYVGRRIDIFWRSIPSGENEPAIAAIGRHFAFGKTRSARELQKKASF
jgi:hypothetical protein